jgi:hypothetical protein
VSLLAAKTPAEANNNPVTRPSGGQNSGHGNNSSENQEFFTKL